MPWHNDYILLLQLSTLDRMRIGWRVTLSWEPLLLSSCDSSSFVWTLTSFLTSLDRRRYYGTLLLLFIFAICGNATEISSSFS